MAFNLEMLSDATLLQSYVKPKKLNIFIADVSGSMSRSMPQLKRDMVERIDKLPLHDFLLFGIFSEKGWFKWICSQPLDATEDYEKCKYAVTKELYARSMTCFSEILADTPKAIAPFLSKYEVITFTFFSDGIPTTYPISLEDENIKLAAEKLAPFITSGAVLAYSDYADRMRLSKLAQMLNVEFISTDSVDDIGESFERINKQNSSKKKTVKLKDGWDFAFSLSPNNEVSVLSITDRKVVTDEQNFVFVWNKQQAKGASRKAKMSVKVQYATALALLLNNQPEDSLELLSNIGDVGMVQLLGSALTNAELTKVEKMIRDAMQDKNKRFMKGRKVGCLPKEDAFDVIDCFNLLMTDEECVFYPYHENFKYKRIGRNSKKNTSYPEFIPNKETGVPIINILGHANELNLSVRTKIDGYIDLPEEIFVDSKKFTRKESNLFKKFYTSIYRTYTFIHNAMLNVTFLPVSIKNKDIMRKLYKENVIDSVDGNIVTLDLSQLPICNKLKGKFSSNFNLLAERAYENVVVKNTLKVYKEMYENLCKEMGTFSSNGYKQYEENDLQYLEYCGINPKTLMYDPKTEYEEATDVLDIYSFEIKVSLSSSVSMKQLEEQQKKQKFNFVGQIMQETYLAIKKNMPVDKESALEYLKTNVDSLTRVSRNQQNEINAQRFAIALTGQWTKNFKEDVVEFLVGPNKNHVVKLEFKKIQKKI